MRSVAVAASALAFAASAMAQVEGFAAMSAPAKDEKVAAGTTYSIEWDAGTYTGPVVISLLGGKTPETLQPGAQIAADVPVTNNKFAWSVDCSLGTDETYGIKIASQSDESLFQYSFPFHIDNSGCGAESATQSGPGGYPTSVISVSNSAYPTAPPVWSTSCESSSTVIPSSTVVPPPVVNTTTPVYPTTAPPPVETTPIVSTPVEVPVSSSSLITYVTSAPPATSSTSAPTPTVVPVAGAGRNAAGSLAALIAIGVAVAL